MNQPATQGKSTLFWIVLVTAGTCAMCTLTMGGLVLLALLSPDDAPPVAVTASVRSPSRIPTGNTPDLFPGSPGFLPSGRGVPIPPAEVVDGEPRGLWWHPQVRSMGKTVAIPVLFLAGGIRASNPRPGSGTDFDLEGQRAQKGNTGVGTFRVEDGKLTQEYDGFTSTEPLSFGDDEEGPWMKLGAAQYWPLAPPNEAAMPGKWRTSGGAYLFRDDGTYESGHVDVNAEWAVGGKGTWLLDGYLLQISPTGAPSWITTIGATGDRFLVIGTSLYDRE